MAREYGWTDEYIESLPVPTFQSYFLAIKALRANDMLYNIDAAMTPHLKKDKISKKFLDYKKQIREVVGESRLLSAKEVAQNLARKLMNGR